MEEVFESVTENHKQNQIKQQELSEEQIQALRDSTQTTTQAIENQTRAIEHSCDNLNENLQKSNKEGIQEYDEFTNRNNQVLTSLVNSNQVDSIIVKTVSNLPNDKNKSQFSLKPVDGISSFFTINPTNPQRVQIKVSTMNFQNDNTYNLRDPDLSYFIPNTQIDRKVDNVGLIKSSLRDMKYDSTKDKSSDRYNFIKDLLQPQIGRGLKFHLAGVNLQFIFFFHLIQMSL